MRINFQNSKNNEKWIGTRIHLNAWFDGGNCDWFWFSILLELLLFDFEGVCCCCEDEEDEDGSCWFVELFVVDSVFVDVVDFVSFDSDDWSFVEWEKYDL